MKKEVEILVEVLEDKALAMEKLAGLNYLGDKQTLDVYFFDPLREDLQADSDGQLKNCLRIRQQDDKTLLAYKIDHFNEQGIWLYSDEIETVVADYDKIEMILIKLDLKELIRIENTKSTYTTDKYEVVLEEVKNLGLFMEVERHDVSDDEDIIKVKEEIWQWLTGLNIKATQELTMGKPELMLRKINA